MIIVRFIIDIFGMVSGLIAEGIQGVVSVLGAILIFQSIALKTIKTYQKVSEFIIGLILIIFFPVAYYLTMPRAFLGDANESFLVLVGFSTLIGVIYLARAIRLPRRLFLILNIISFVAVFVYDIFFNTAPFFWADKYYPVLERYFSPDLARFLEINLGSVFLLLISVLMLIFLFMTISLFRLFELDTEQRKNEVRYLIIGSFLIVVVGALIYSYNSIGWIKWEKENPNVNKVPIIQEHKRA